MMPCKSLSTILQPVLVNSRTGNGLGDPPSIAKKYRTILLGCQLALLLPNKSKLASKLLSANDYWSNRMYELESSWHFDQQVLRWKNSTEAWDEVWFNFDVQLARNPLWGDQIPGTNLWALGLETHAPLTIFYSINQNKMTIRLEDIAEV